MTMRTQQESGFYCIELLARREPVSQEIETYRPGQEGRSAFPVPEQGYHQQSTGRVFQRRTFRVYGLDLPEIKAVLPTNIPAVKVNELRLDNLFELADGSAAIVDYESEYKKEDKIKYLNYLTGIANRYLREKKHCPILRMIVIYTGDIKRKQISAEYDIGAVRITLEPAFLSELDSDRIFRHLKQKVEKKEMLDDEELMYFIILPLSYRKRNEKDSKIRESVQLAVQIHDRHQQLFTLAGILAFTDKMIDAETANKIRRAIEMTKVAQIFEEEKQQALAELEEKSRQALEKAKEEKKQAIAKAKKEKKQAIAEAKKEKKRADNAEAKLHQTARESVLIMLKKNYPSEEIASIVPLFIAFYPPVFPPAYGPAPFYPVNHIF